MKWKGDATTGSDRASIELRRNRDDLVGMDMKGVATIRLVRTRTEGERNSDETSGAETEWQRYDWYECETARRGAERNRRDME